MEKGQISYKYFSNFGCLPPKKMLLILSKRRLQPVEIKLSKSWEKKTESNHGSTFFLFTQFQGHIHREKVQG